MNRCYTKEQFVELALKIRREIPDIAITTDIIVGFPGETHADVLETIDVIKTVKFDNAFTFQYSKRTGTPAATMENQVPQEEVTRNFDELLAVVQQTAREQALRFEHQTLDALVEGINEHDSSLVTGRLSNNMIVHFKGCPDLIGKIVPVYLKECKGFYYLGEMK